MPVIMRPFIWILISLGMSGFAYSASHARPNADPTTDDAILVQIKEQLVVSAQAAETNVVNTSWLDGEGQLHESTLIRSKVRVRGVQVKRYLEEMNRPKVEISLDEKMGVLPECFMEDDHLTRTVVFEPSQLNGRFDVDQFGVVKQIGDFSEQQLKKQLANSSFWSVVDISAALNPYLRVVTGVVPTVAQYGLTIVISPGTAILGHKPERIPGSDPVSAYFKGTPSWFDEAWVRISVALRNENDGSLVWSDQKHVRIPARRVEYSNELLANDLRLVIASLTESWSSALNQYARCEPIHFNVTRRPDESYQIDGGRASGINVNDSLLLVDRENVPKRALDPGALSDLTLWKVIYLEENSASIELAAGPELKEIGGKVALPF